MACLVYVCMLKSLNLASLHVNILIQPNRLHHLMDSMKTSHVALFPQLYIHI